MSENTENKNGATFIETTYSYFKELVKNDLCDSNALYFVNTKTATGKRYDQPYLLFKGKELVGNSGTLIKRATNGILNIDGNSFNVRSSGVPAQFEGFPGQVLYVIDESTDTNGDKSYVTYVFTWVESENNGNGKWVNSNCVITQRININGIDVKAEDITSLLGLLATDEDRTA